MCILFAQCLHVHHHISGITSWASEQQGGDGDVPAQVQCSSGAGGLLQEREGESWTQAGEIQWVVVQDTQILREKHGHHMIGILYRIKSNHINLCCSQSYMSMEERRKNTRLSSLLEKNKKNLHLISYSCINSLFHFLSLFFTHTYTAQ